MITALYVSNVTNGDEYLQYKDQNSINNKSIDNRKKFYNELKNCNSWCGMAEVC